MLYLPLPAHNPGPYTGPAGNNTYLLPGREPALVDAGVGDGAHLDSIEAALGGAPLARVIVTHAHSDHAGGAEKIAARWPSARFLKMPWPDRDARYPVAWMPLADGDRVPAGDSDLVVVHTPGHAPDHVCLWHEPSGLLFAGDLAASHTTVVIPGGRGGSVAAYLRSLERVLALRPRALLPAHGEAIDDVERVLRGYIDHRLARERQVLEALAAGATTVEEIAAALYPTLREELRGAARDSVLAHLLKLESEGRASRSGDAWRGTHGN